MIKFVDGDMFAVEADIRVNTVNCVGTMGKGIAAEFKKRYPTMYEEYRKDCLHTPLIKPGNLWIWIDDEDGEIIINFPTKDHWRGKSNYEWIEKGLRQLRECLTNRSGTICIPVLGCGNGDLDWDKVKPMIERHLLDLDMEVLVFKPQ